MFGALFPINLSSFTLLLVASAAGNNGASPPSRLRAQQSQSHLLHARGERDIGWKACLPDSCIPLLAVCCDDNTYCLEGTKCVSTNLCCPGSPGCPEDSSILVSATEAPSTQTAQRSSVSGHTNSQAESSSFDYASAISEYISVFTEVTQLIITTTASDGNTSVTTEEVLYTTTVMVSANSPANASAQFNATASLLSNTATLTSSSSGATASSSSSSSGAAKMVGWTGASIALAVLVTFVVSVVFNLQ